MDDQRGRLEVSGEVVRRPLLVHLFVGPGRALELPLREPQLLGSAVLAGQVVDARVREQALEAVSVAQNPVGHVAAVAAAAGADAGLVHERQRLNVVHRLHDVGVDLAAPVGADLVHELLPPAGTAARVGRHHHVAGRGEQLHVPAEVEAVVPGALRAAVDEHDHGVFLRRVEAGRLDEPTLHLRALGPFDTDGLGGIHLQLGQQGVVDVRDLRGAAGARAGAEDLGGGVRSLPGENQGRAVGRDTKTPVGSLFHHGLDGAGQDRDPVDGRARVHPGGEKDAGAIRHPDKITYVVVEVGRQRANLPRSSLVEHELVAVGLEPFSFHGDVGDPAPVGRVLRRAVPAFAGGDFPGLAAGERDHPDVAVGAHCFVRVGVACKSHFEAAGREAVLV